MENKKVGTSTVQQEPEGDENPSGHSCSSGGLLLAAGPENDAPLQLVSVFDRMDFSISQFLDILLGSWRHLTLSMLSLNGQYPR